MPTVVARQPLTARQRDILLAVVRHFGEHMAPPTVRDVGNAVGIASPNGVMSQLKALARKGWIELPGKQARGIRVPDLADAVRRIADQQAAAISAELVSG